MIDTESFQSVNTIASTSEVFQKCNCLVKVLMVWWLTLSHFNRFIALTRTKGSVPTLFIPSRISLINSLLFVLIAITFGISVNFWIMTCLFFLSRETKELMDMFRVWMGISSDIVIIQTAALMQRISFIWKLMVVWYHWFYQAYRLDKPEVSNLDQNDINFVLSRVPNPGLIKDKQKTRKASYLFRASWSVFVLVKLF